ncbi:3-methyladenine DNA glycosylase 2 [Pusillimonas sp. MFBS29]|uniref:DNA-3-methyladenine glycosylase family protein n=1 Tax=Pusillimonas sp. MFBS29 TaxID=2886690 RepID=UPI001D107FBD|nr:AlkA N-terminal domain-containing protein [Pusillimonas sp. MFBS29]MCC2596361.1 3-methyladenine DNA glycosylase 2 [Pusillimonas sp. MFBS29]
MATQLRCRIPLPPDYRPQDILAFHRRDTQEIAERVDDSSLHKGLLWQGMPGHLSVRLRPRQASVELTLDGTAPTNSQSLLKTMVHRMLGLTQDIDTFEQQYRRHPLLGQLIAKQAGLRVPLAVTPFEALSWAIIGQQISVSAAVSIRRRLILATGLRHSSGLLCHPGPQEILALTPETLRQAGFSTGKARALQELAGLVASKQLVLDTDLQAAAIESLRDRLLAIRGIGPWTVNYTLLRGLGWLDGSLHGDVVVRHGIAALLGTTEKLNEKQAQAWLQEFSPWRALLAAHLWASRSTTAY